MRTFNDYIYAKKLSDILLVIGTLIGVAGFLTSYWLFIPAGILLLMGYVARKASSE